MTNWAEEFLKEYIQEGDESQIVDVADCLLAMEKYGRYCAIDAWEYARKKYSGDGNALKLSKEGWWNAFQKQREQSIANKLRRNLEGKYLYWNQLTNLFEYKTGYELLKEWEEPK